ncbi:MAG: thioredoxin domain-containing protein [Ignavibacteria bacterium]|nr:thioredoxin domain-containing protein [Ignavibacteria bacterium]
MKLSLRRWQILILSPIMVVLLAAVGFFLMSPGNPQSGKSTQEVSQKNTIESVINQNLAEGKKPNRLINEKSPYLLQHAFNPVDWYSWGEEAFEKARKEDKPIFLSIGYSTCYWCHVMEREVFENDSIAELMNRYVISIKVDREERPDVDRVYMAAVQAMTGSGGWPMSMFLTHDLKPFYGATYIPPEPNYGRPGFPQILDRIHEMWSTNRKQVLDSGQRLADHLERASSPETKTVELSKKALEQGFDSYSRSYDPVDAGFGGAPKFPRPVSFNFLLRYYKRAREQTAMDMTLETLKRMAHGGMYDHLGGGFHRYSTDKRWHVPHFEKMLYDQAQLVISYLEAYQITGERYYADVARDVLQYVLRMMSHPDGGFYSAEDAESATDKDNPSEKEEGAFYVWTKSEIDEILSPDEATIFNRAYGVEEDGNVVADPHNVFKGKNILFVAYSPEEIAKQLSMPLDKVEATLANARPKMFDAQEIRLRPHLDDKILVSWNGLMISAFARAYQVLGDEQYLEAAEGAGEFILQRLHNPQTRVLLRRYRDGEARFEAHLEDYAFFVQALLDLYEASFNIRWLKVALELTEEQVRLFSDKDRGGFYDISGRDESILIRTKETYDGAEPTGNSIAILNLLRLSQMTGQEEYHAMAKKSLEYFGEQMMTYPQGMPQFLVALDFSLSKPKQIIIAGRRNDAHTLKLLKEVHSRFIPSKILLLADNGEGQKILASHVPFLESVTMIDGKSTAYICENYTCQLPTSDLLTVAKLLDE